MREENQDEMKQKVQILRTHIFAMQTSSKF